MQSPRVPLVFRISRAVLLLAFTLFLALPSKAADERAVKSKVAPVYPEMAKRLQIGGSVKVKALVEPDGTVTEVKTVSGNHMLAPAAEDAVRKWKFVPGASQTSVDVEVNFAFSK